MGRLTIPTSGTVYLDANSVLYTVNQHPLYEPVIIPVWEAAANGVIQIISSELTLLETLVVPMRLSDLPMQQHREGIWKQKNTSLLPITQDVLREAARLRALITGLKTPDALHAATGLLHGCALFVTNDPHFRRVPNLPLAILDDVLAAP